MRWYNDFFARELDAGPVPAYAAEDFDRMLDEQAVQTVVVTSVDSTHDRYITAALRHGCDVVTEKPLTIDAPRCQAIIDAVRASGGRVTVAHNYRYSPRNALVKDLLDSGEIGRVHSVHFEWLLDTHHGADYFRRWHRDRSSSGGLMVHKASHHFDLVNWWLGARPEVVFGFGQLSFYGRANAERRGVTQFYDRSLGSEAARRDPFGLDLAADPWLRGLYLEAEHEDGYIRDRSVFGDGISIEDDMAVVIRYSGGATLTYHLTAYSPWEGYRVAFNGSGGRLELEVVEQPRAGVRISVRPHWQGPREIPFEPQPENGHGGGDVRMLSDLYGHPAGTDTPSQLADHVAGALAILPGIGANMSFASGQPVDLTRLLRF